jgi:hypothetical protein
MTDVKASLRAKAKQSSIWGEDCFAKVWLAMTK